MCQGTKIRARAHPGLEVCPFAVPAGDGKLLDFYFLRLELDFMAFAGQLVGRNARNFFGRKWRRQLLLFAYEIGGGCLELLQRKVDELHRAGGIALSIVRVCSPAKADYAFVPLIGLV